MDERIVLILTSKKDQSTNNVIKWLIFYKQKYIRINIEDTIYISEIVISNINIDFSIKVNNHFFLYSEIKSIWFWKGNFNIEKNNIEISDDFPYKKQMVRSLAQDRNILLQFINNCFLAKKSLGNIFQSDINKLDVLNYATQIGLKIPNTLITTKKANLIEFHKIHLDIISKAISTAPLYYNLDIGDVHGYTSLIDEKRILGLSDNFPLTLFQNYIKKLYEIRTFYLDGNFYSMAIFSQIDNKTSVDFRDYNYQKPNRTVPYNLPENIENKLKLLIDRFKLNTASFDIAFNIDFEHILFEVNPVGQYGMTSLPCNYNIDRKIAEFLI